MDFTALKEAFKDFEKNFIYTDIKDVWVKEAQKKYPYPVQSFAYGSLDFSSFETLFDHTEAILKKEKPKVLIAGSAIGRLSFYLKNRWPDAEIKSIDIVKPYIDFSNKLKKEHQLEGVRFELEDAKECSYQGYDYIVLFADLWTREALAEVYAKITTENPDALIISTRRAHKNYLTEYMAKETLELKSSWNEKLLTYLIVKNDTSYLNALNSWKVDSKQYCHKLFSVFKEQILKAESIKEKEKALETFEKIADFASDSFLDIFEVEATRLALQYEEEVKDMDKSIYWYKKAANAGSELSQLKLGLLYQEGRLVSENRKEAIKWLQMAAECGSQVAVDYFCHITSLEALKLYGDGKNLQGALEALRLLNNELILSQTKSKALFELIISTVAMFFLDGKIGAKEIEEGYYFIKVADEIGCSLAQKYMGDIAFQVGNFFLNMFEEGTHKRDFQKAEVYYKEAYIRSIPSSNWLLALSLFEQNKMLDFEELLKKEDKEEAEHIYGKLFYIYFLGDVGFKEDLSKAQIWLERLQDMEAEGVSDLNDLFLVKKNLEEL